MVPFSIIFVGEFCVTIYNGLKVCKWVISFIGFYIYLQLHAGVLGNQEEI